MSGLQHRGRQLGPKTGPAKLPDVDRQTDRLTAAVSRSGFRPEFFKTAVAGVFGQVGPSLYGAATYSTLAVIDDGFFADGHFVAAEVGYVFGTRMRFAPTVRVYTRVLGDLVEVEDFPDLSFLVGLSIQAGY